jgi:NADH:ubiquinone oxidoreductase subunit
MTTLGTRLLTWLRGELMGSDPYGNRYYRLKNDRPSGRGGGRFSRERRWVIYKGEPEGSKVPYEVPGAWPHYAWEKPHEPNLTGTPLAYHPPGSVLRGGHRARATGDYEPWSPE